MVVCIFSILQALPYVFVLFKIDLWPTGQSYFAFQRSILRFTRSTGSKMAGPRNSKWKKENLCCDSYDIMNVELKKGYVNLLKALMQKK